MFNFPIIKNFHCEDYTDTQTNFYFDYISLTNGLEFQNINVLLTEAESSGEFLVCINSITGALSLQDPFVALPVGLTPLFWITQGLVFEEYFINSNEIWDQQNKNLYLPRVYLGELTETPVKTNENFRAFGKNFPAVTNPVGVLKPGFPGINNTGTTTAIQKEYPSIAKFLTKSFTDNMVSSGSIVRTSWETKFGPNSGTDFSSNMLGLSRDDYSFIEKVPQLRKDVANRAINDRFARDTVFLTEVNGQKVISVNSIEDFKYSLTVKQPSDLALDLITGSNRPITIYSADQKEGTVINHSSGIIVNLQPERYIPNIKLDTVIPVAAFKPGFSYNIQPGQPLPSGWISTGPNTGRLPNNGVRSWNYQPINNGTNNHGPVSLWQAKTTRHSAEFLYKLYKLRKGKKYDCITDTIQSGVEDFEQLTLETIPTLTADFIVGDIVGYEDNLVTIRLPFDYKRDGLEWTLAQDISKAFLGNYTIGYHEFVADYSVVGEPVFAIEPCFDPAEASTIVTVSFASSLFDTEDILFSYLTDEVIPVLLPDSTAFIATTTNVTVLLPDSTAFVPPSTLFLD